MSLGRPRLSAASFPNSVIQCHGVSLRTFYTLCDLPTLKIYVVARTLHACPDAVVHRLTQRIFGGKN